MNDASRSPVYLAVDFGAGSGRVMGSWILNGQLQLEEVHRFPNDGLNLNGTWHWNVTQQFAHMLEGLRRAASRYGERVTSIGIDTWGVDYGLVDASGSLLGIPVQYRDSRTDGKMEEAFARMPEEKIYEATGTQFMPFNTVFQLLAEQERHPDRLEAARRLLFIPDLFNFWLTGVQSNETTIASTAQLVNAASGEWAWEVIDRLGFPRRLFQELTPPGTVLGPLLPDLREITGLTHAKVVTVGSHDTASAYTGVPMIEEAEEGAPALFLSSGTWSLLGTETPQAVISRQSFDLSFTNERATSGEIRLLKNHCGMWLMQECKRIWDQEEKVSWEQLTAEANATEPFLSLIHPDDARFAKRCNMPARLQQACAASGQPVPQTRGAITRMICESLALTYRITATQLTELVGNELAVLHVVGGGCQNRLLNQFSANALGRKVIAGPVEATAMGNVLSQLTADGSIPDLQAGRRLINHSIDIDHFEPHDTPAWDAALERFRQLWG